VWEHVAYRYLGQNSQQVLFLCEHVLARICREHRAAASHNSQGFIAVWGYANRYVVREERNRQWLQERIAEASTVSLQMVNSLWHYYGAPGQPSVLRPDDTMAARQHEILTLRENLVSCEALERTLDARFPSVLYDLVFDPGDHNPASEGDLPAWNWLGPVLLDCLRRESITAATCIAWLMTACASGAPRRPLAVDPNVLGAFFRDDTPEVIDRLGQLASRVVEKDQRELVTAIAETGKIALSAKNSATGSK
jgi:hypothetical protein